MSNERSKHLHAMNVLVHAAPLRSPERSHLAMAMYDYILAGQAKPAYSNPKFRAYERAGARA